MEATGKSEEQRKKDTINTQIQKDLQKAEQLSEAAKKGLAEGVCQSRLILSVYPSVCFHMFVTFCLSIYHYCLSIHLSVSICLSSVYPSTITVCHSVSPTVWLSLSVFPFVHLSIFLSIHLSLFLVGLSLYAAQRHEQEGTSMVFISLALCLSFFFTIKVIII